ncbi:hypothetical protein E6O75_ATG02239 [Venturia nashicola]|uniref:Uncharacterized protein n=1 Tax=Venturia nashicola TaxID=86259 RepID=A0A4Z1P514_9PEZI|nr:hypothetical protein E6O75_ATG02239 [Venturia nashicola]
MPPSFKTIVGHALSQPAQASTAATNTVLHPTERLIAMTPGSDYILRLHVEGKQEEVKGTVLQDPEVIQVSPTESKDDASITSGEIPTSCSRASTRDSLRITKTLVVPAVTHKSAFGTVVVSTSQVRGTLRASVLVSRTMSILVSTSTVEGWTSRASVQQATRTPTPAPAIGRVNNLPIWTPFLYALVAFLAIAVWFSIIVYRINCRGDPPFRDRFSSLGRIFSRDEKMGGRNTQGNKVDDRKLHPILHNGRRGNFCTPCSMESHKYKRTNIKKATARSTSYPPPPPPSSSTINSSVSPPQTPRASSYSEFAPQAITTSSAYNTPTATPIQSSFPPTTLRHRSHIPASLIVEPTTNSATGVDLEDQTAMQTPSFSALRSRASGNLGAKGEGEGKGRKVARMGSSRWVEGIVEGVIDGVIRWTRDEGGERKAVGLPVSEW